MQKKHKKPILEIPHQREKTKYSKVPQWIKDIAKKYGKDACSIEEARRISLKFKTPLSEEIIAEREASR